MNYHYHLSDLKHLYSSVTLSFQNLNFLVWLITFLYEGHAPTFQGCKILNKVELAK